MALKSTVDIRELLSKAHLDFKLIVNKALNNYLPKIFHFVLLQRAFVKQNNAWNVLYLKNTKNGCPVKFS